MLPGLGSETKGVHGAGGNRGWLAYLGSLGCCRDSDTTGASGDAREHRFKWQAPSQPVSKGCQHPGGWNVARVALGGGGQAEGAMFLSKVGALR